MKYFTCSLITLTVLMSCAALAENVGPGNRAVFDQRRVVVEFHDLDLTSPAEARIFLNRIKRAVFKSCERRPLGERLWAGKDQQRCMAETEATSLANIKAGLNIDVEVLAAKSTGTQNNAVAGGR